MQCSGVQWSVVQCSAVECSGVECSAVECSGVQWSGADSVEFFLLQVDPFSMSTRLTLALQWGNNLLTILFLVELVMITNMP